MTELNNIAKTISTSTGAFRQAANENNRNLSRVVKDVSMHFGSQKNQYSTLSSIIRSQGAANENTNRKVDQTNALMKQSLNIQQQLLDAVKEMNKSVKAIKPSGEAAGGVESNGILSRFKGVAAALGIPLAAGAGGAVIADQVIKGGKAVAGGMAVPTTADDGKAEYKLNIGEGEKKRELNISEKDIERLAKIIKAEAGGTTEGVGGRQAVIDTILNRAASGRKDWGADGGVRGVINQPKQFSPINDVGDVDNLPHTRNLAPYKQEVRDYLKAKTEGRSQLTNQHTMFANPSISGQKALNTWIPQMGEQRQYGRHVHGTNKGVTVPNYSVSSVAQDAPPTAKANPDGVGRGRRGGNGRLPESMLTSIGSGHKLVPQAAAAYNKMVEAAKADGITWSITDSYRTYDQQVKVAREKGLYSQGGLAATPGRSNHGWGTALDLGGGANQAGSKQNKWLQQNAARFGFSTIAREPWHWEYKGGGGGDAVAEKGGTEEPTAAGAGGQTAGASGGGGSGGAPAGGLSIAEGQKLLGVGMGTGRGNVMGGMGGGIGGFLGGAMNLMQGAFKGSSLQPTPQPDANMVPEAPESVAKTSKIETEGVKAAALEANAQEASTKPQAAPVVQVNNQTAERKNSKPSPEDPFTSGRHVSASWADKLLDSYYGNPQGIKTA